MSGKYLLLTILTTFFLATQPNHCFAQFTNLYSAYDTLTYDGDPGNTTIIIYIGNNDSDSSAGGLLALYVSTDTILNTQEDSVLFIISEPEVGSGDTSLFTITVDFCNPLFIDLLPAYAQGGAPFYLLYKLDYGENNFESNENDNVGAILPNLYIGCTLGMSTLITDQFLVYPNPGSGILNITLPFATNKDVRVTIQNINTQLEISLGDLNNASQKTFDISFLTAGIYILKVQSGDQHLQKKIIIEK